MEIAYLADNPALIPELARLHRDQWGHLRPDETLEQRISRLEACCGRHGVPSVLVALEDGALVGSAMLIANDMDTRPDLTPWLAGVYVVEPFRDRGIGSALVRRVEADASALGVGRLYLYTPDATRFYEGLGWAVVERREYLGQPVDVMAKDCE